MYVHTSIHQSKQTKNILVLITSSVSGMALAAGLLSSSSEGALQVVVTLLKHTPNKEEHDWS